MRSVDGASNTVRIIYDALASRVYIETTGKHGDTVVATAVAIDAPRFRWMIRELGVM